MLPPFLLPIENLPGFGAGDLLELFVGLILVTAILARARLLVLAQRLAGRPVLCMFALAALPIALRLALLARHPVPVPRVADDFSYLLLGDTLARFRLANPMHPMHRFFEGVFVLQEPSWSSKYPIGQGLALAFGELVFRLPWAGVLLSVGLLCALCYWMLRAWVDPVWALAGALLAVIEFGPLSTWTNTYWGGAVSGIAGCLVFGALPRIGKTRRTREAVFLGAGLGLQMLTRPYEFVWLLLAVLLFLLPLRSLLIAVLVVLPAFGITLLQNRQVTGNWLTLPYELSQYQYGVPTSFSFQSNPLPHRPLTPEQQVDYNAQTLTHNSSGSYFRRLIERIDLSGFFFLPPLYLALPFFLSALKETRFICAVSAIVLLWLGDAFYPYFYPHYIAAAACLFILVSVKGLEHMSQFAVGKLAVTLILALCFAHFLFYYGMAAARSDPDPEHRAAIDKQLHDAPGRQLVFVHYGPQHGEHEWIHNAADVDKAQTVWALDLGPAEDEVLRRYYPDRHVWFLDADAAPPRLTSN